MPKLKESSWELHPGDQPIFLGVKTWTRGSLKKEEPPNIGSMNKKQCFFFCGDFLQFVKEKKRWEQKIRRCFSWKKIGPSDLWQKVQRCFMAISQDEEKKEGEITIFRW